MLMRCGLNHRARRARILNTFTLSRQSQVYRNRVLAASGPPAHAGKQLSRGLRCLNILSRSCPATYPRSSRKVHDFPVGRARMPLNQDALTMDEWGDGWR